MNPGRQLGLQLSHFRRHPVGNRNRVTRGLTGDVEQHSGFAVGP